MKKIINKFFSILTTIVLVITNIFPFLPLNVFAYDTIVFELDEATVAGNVITFSFESTSITATVSGNGYSFNGTQLSVTYSEINTIKFTLSDNFDQGTMRLQLSDNNQALSIADVGGTKEAILDGIIFSDDHPHLGLMVDEQQPDDPNPNPDPDTQSYVGNATATLNFQITGAIEYYGGPFNDMGISFKINGITYKTDHEIVYEQDTSYERDEHGQVIIDDGTGQPIPILDPETNEPMEELVSATVTGDTIHYDADGETVDFIFMMNPGTLIETLTINGTPINDLPSSAAELEACYTDHRLEIPVNGITKQDTYNIVIEARYPTSEEEFMGNFLWDYNPVGYTGPDDKILNATMTFVRAEYGDDVYTTPEEVQAAGGVFIWQDAERKKTYVDDREGCGEAQFPKGTILSVTIIPDAGYQLIDFGINGGVFETQEEMGTYTFEVGGGPFHLQATIAQVEDVVKTQSEKIEGGTITLGGEEEAMQVGTARLDVTDIELSPEQISNFEEASNGYNISTYVDISLYNTVFKGTENQSWDTEVKNLENEATITLKLEDGVNYEEVVIVHEKDDGTYEIIPVEYDPENNTITFVTKSFSNYAIATKGANPKTSDDLLRWLTLLFVSVIFFGMSSIKVYKAYNRS